MEVEETIDNTRELTILTWGKAARKYKPESTEKNWSVEMISINDLYLKKITGKNPIIQNRLLIESNFIKLLKGIVKEVEEKNYKTISICCTHGRHRSVATAELLKKLYYPNATINHLDL